MDIEIHNQYIGRMEFELFDVVPYTAHNFFDMKNINIHYIDVYLYIVLYSFFDFEFINKDEVEK